MIAVGLFRVNKRSMKSKSLSILLGCLTVLCGCEQGPRYYEVTGTVSLDGKPLEEAGIIFSPMDSSLGPEPSTIKNGQYSLRALEGKKRVEISASKIIPGSKVRGAGGEPVPEEYLPAKYNMNSELTADVKPSGPNKFDFDLKSK